MSAMRKVKLTVPYLRNNVTQMMQEVYSREKGETWSIRPDDWPEELPFGDPNNGVKQKQPDGTIVRGRKPPREDLLKMFYFLQSKQDENKTSKVTIQQLREKMNFLGCLNPSVKNEIDDLCETFILKIVSVITSGQCKNIHGTASAAVAGKHPTRDDPAGNVPNQSPSTATAAGISGDLESHDNSSSDGHSFHSRSKMLDAVVRKRPASQTKDANAPKRSREEPSSGGQSTPPANNLHVYLDEAAVDENSFASRLPQTTAGHAKLSVDVPKTCHYASSNRPVTSVTDIVVDNKEDTTRHENGQIASSSQYPISASAHTSSSDPPRATPPTPLLSLPPKIQLTPCKHKQEVDQQLSFNPKRDTEYRVDFQPPGDVRSKTTMDQIPDVADITLGSDSPAMKAAFLNIMKTPPDLDEFETVFPNFESTLSDPKFHPSKFEISSSALETFDDCLHARADLEGGAGGVRTQDPVSSPDMSNCCGDE